MVMHTTSAPWVVTVDYDAERDVLFAYVRPKPETRNRWAARDLWWLVTADGDIAGFECLWFSQNVKDPKWLAALPTEPTLYHLHNPSERLTLAEVLPEVWGLAGQRLQAQEVKFGLRPAA
jgi:uncharacterized protein YuzE